jgi:hypothetical protein
MGKPEQAEELRKARVIQTVKDIRMRFKQGTILAVPPKKP